ncbi:urease accessory protein UreD [Amycolatopsis regifaucium]|uniref:Urease accessory protein UreD n=1 Tax=Amycolatopsis regifaucium TaxID=546365 RepID=A0A154MU95_9PSEU|nr:urease accessory protein UreD [Amycolatopsis regifaucium]KZB87307.1 urease accessory protein ureD [Amycolatopsis regifaucium]OKA08141.1 urease accessory protein [Amycolatopsis regifaucium]SFI40958.1 urease accessory protein [Amycolatopsis regifaucium]
MKAHARLAACFEGGRTVLRELRSMAPLTLLPKRGTGATAIVHLVNSATSPLGGDELKLTIRVGPGASLRISGVAATIALPGLHGEGSSSLVDIEVGEGGSLEYLPEPTVVTARARHSAVFKASLASGAYLHTREVLVLGRAGERPGSLVTTQHVTRDECPVLRQTLEIGDSTLDSSLAHLAGRRVLATDLVVGGPELSAASGDWWSRTPLAAGGILTTSLAPDAVTALKPLENP